MMHDDSANETGPQKDATRAAREQKDAERKRAEQEGAVRDLVNRSGFPLQMGIRRLVEDEHSAHHWTVVAAEHAWRNDRSGERGFIDLVLQDGRETSWMVIECKRTRSSSWVFLNPQAATRATCWVAYHDWKETITSAWWDVNAILESPESEFCVMEGDESKTRPALLERMSADVIEATEAIALEEQRVKTLRGGLRMYFSVIVTTAALKVCSFSPSRVDVAVGEMGPDAVIQEVEWVRFRKQLAARVPRLPSDSSHYTLSDVAHAQENTVFVVNATALVRFLSYFRVTSDDRIRELQSFMDRTGQPQ
jgi:hypothetical protein